MCTCLYPAPAQYGSAGFAKGASEEEEKPVVPVDGTVPEVVAAIPAADYSESWSLFFKVFLFGSIVAGVAAYIKFSRKKLEREDVGYEKNLA